MTGTTPEPNVGSTTVAATTAAVAAPAWFAKLDDVERAHITLKGYDKLAGDALTEALYRGYRSAEKLIGAPADQIVKWPKDASDADGWKAVNQKLGVPAAPTEYKFDGMAFKDGTAADAAFLEQARGLAFELGLPAAKAPLLAKRIMEWGEAAEEASTNEQRASAGAEMATLKQSWGPNYDLNFFHATKALEMLGLPPETISLLEHTVGFSKAMEGFRVLGTRMNEAELHMGAGGGSASKAMTREEAIARKTILMKDTAYVAAWFNGDADKRKELLDLDRVIVGAPPAPRQ